MRVLVLGAGGIGGTIGGRLAHAGVDVMIADQWPEHVEAMRSHGLRVASPDGFDVTVAVKAMHLHELQSISEGFEVVFLSVKTYDTEWFAQLALRHVAPGGCVVVCQNGITDMRVAGIVGIDRTVGCVVTLAAELVAAGHVVRNDVYPVAFKVGTLSTKATPHLFAISQLLADVGTTQITENLSGERWAKLCTNCMINALSGLTGFLANEVRYREDTVGLLIGLGAEAVLVGRAKAIAIEPVMGIEPVRFVAASRGQGTDGLIRTLQAVSSTTGDHPAAMLQDVRKKRRTEIEDLNGLVAREGRKYQVPTPYCDAVQVIAARYLVRDYTPSATVISDILDQAESYGASTLHGPSRNT